MENWKRIEGFDQYEVSDLGRVRSIDGNVLKGSPTKKGYIAVRLYRGSRTDFKDRTVHKLVASAFLPNPKNLPQVDHLNTIKSDNVATNLEWVTNLTNMKRSWERGTHRPTRGNTKLTDAQRIAIRSASGTQRELAAHFGVSQGTIFNVRNSRTNET